MFKNVDKQREDSKNMKSRTLLAEFMDYLYELDRTLNACIPRNGVLHRIKA